jgi:hypothetical protein
VASLACRTDVHVAPDVAYEFLLDFEGYAKYSEHLASVERDGDGGPGTEYAITATWWRLSHTVRSAVTDVDPPSRIDWRLVDEVDAAGRWHVDDVGRPDAPRSRVTLALAYDPATLSSVDLPLVPSLDWLADKLAPVVRREATAVVERIVADLEGEPRPIDLDVTTPADDALLPDANP